MSTVVYRRKGPKPKPLMDRVLSKVEPWGNGCWAWTGYIMPNGYAKLTNATGSSLVHRIIWEHLVGPIPTGLDIDHLCRNRSCVNPDHLQPVDRATNLGRSYAVKEAQKQKGEALRKVRPKRLHNRDKTHCPSGHAYDAANTRWYRGSRRCKTCDRIRAREAYHRRKGVV